MAMYPIAASENEQETTKIHAAQAASINAGAVISVFDIQLMGTVEKNGNVMRILVCPSTNNSGQSVSLKKVFGEAKVPDDKLSSIDDIIKYLGFSGGIEGTEIDVHQAFYYYSNNKEDIVVVDEKNTINHEYAFSLGITNTLDSKPEDLPFKIESISFSLWNSTRNKIVESMGIHTILDILNKLS